MTVADLIAALQALPAGALVVLDLVEDAFLEPAVVYDEGLGVRIVLDPDDEESGAYAHAIRGMTFETPAELESPEALAAKVDR